MAQKKVITGHKALGWVNTQAPLKGFEMNNRIAAAAATVSCVVASLLIVNTSARAATPFAEPAPRATVGIADIDLASAAGRKLLNSRVRFAAARICLSTNVEPVKVRAARQKCQRSALADGARTTRFVAAMRGDRSGQFVAGAI